MNKVLPLERDLFLEAFFNRFFKEGKVNGRDFYHTVSLYFKKLDYEMTEKQCKARLDHLCRHGSSVKNNIMKEYEINEVVYDDKYNKIYGLVKLVELKYFAVKYKDKVCLVLADDKGDAEAKVREKLYHLFEQIYGAQSALIIVKDINIEACDAWIDDIDVPTVG